MYDLKGKIIHCDGIASHNLPKPKDPNRPDEPPKNRPCVVLGSGSDYGLDPSALVVATLTRNPIHIFPFNYFPLLGETKRQTNRGFIDYSNCVAIPNEHTYFQQSQAVRDIMLPHAFAEVQNEVARRAVFPPVKKVTRPIHAEMTHFPKPGFLAFYNDTALKSDRSAIFRNGFLSAALVVGYGAEFGLYSSSVICVPFRWHKIRDRDGLVLRDRNEDVRIDLREFLNISIPTRGSREGVFPDTDGLFAVPGTYYYFPANFGKVSRPDNRVYARVTAERHSFKVDTSEVEHWQGVVGSLEAPKLRIVQRPQP